MRTLLTKMRRAAPADSMSRDQRGLTTVEYVILLVVIAIVSIGVWRTFGQAVRTQITNSTGDINSLR